MAQNANENTQRTPSRCSCKRSKIPIKTNSQIETNTQTKSGTKFIVVSTDQPTTIISRIPIPLTKSSEYNLSIKVVKSAKSDINADCTCKKNIEKEIVQNEEEFDEIENEKVEDAPPKICKVCVCDSGICPAECLQAKKERFQRFMNTSIQRKFVAPDESLKAKQEGSQDPTHFEDKIDEGVSTSVKESQNKKPVEDEVDDKFKEVPETDKELQNKEPVKVGDKSKEVPKKVCKDCKCTKPCNADCEAAQKRIAEEKRAANKICEFCRCTKPCNANCEARKKSLAENNQSEDVCKICKCKKPCLKDCENKKKALTVCEICKCTKPCNKDCEAKKKSEPVKKPICEICKCEKPCNNDCEAKKKAEICKCKKPCLDGCEGKKKSPIICEVCKCSKPCNNDCEAKKKSETVKKPICEICKCTKPCNKDCEAKKKSEVKLVPKVCGDCKCSKPCNIACAANKKNKSVDGEVMAGTHSKERDGGKVDVVADVARKVLPICEVCGCSTPCNNDCEAKKKEEAEKKSQIDEICKCIKACMDEIETKRNGILGEKAVEMKKEICYICKCAKPCHNECERKKKLDEKNKRALFATVQKELEKKICDICRCKNPVTDDNAKNKISAEVAFAEGTLVEDSARKSLEKLETIAEEKDAVGEPAVPIEAVEPKIDQDSKIVSINEVASEGSAVQASCLDAELIEDDKKKVCDVCRCGIGACHAICAEIKKLREDINKPAEPTPCDACDCPPNPCNDLCIRQMNKSVEANINVETVTQTTTYTDIECGTDEVCTIESQTIKSSMTNYSEGGKQATQLISELSSVISDINSSCKRAESIREKSPRSNQTDSELVLIIKQLRQKCKMKDIFIDAMISDLCERKTSKVFDSLLRKIAYNTKSVCDFDRVTIANALPRPESVSPVRTVKARNISDCGCTVDDELAGFRVIVVKPIGPSLLIRWTAAQDVSVIGYHVYVDGKVRGKVFNRLRTSVLLDCLDLKKEIMIQVYATSKDGRSEPPAVKIYSPCNC